MNLDLTGEWQGHQRLGLRDCTVVKVPRHPRGMYTAMYAHIKDKPYTIVSALDNEIIAIEGHHEPADVASFRVSFDGEPDNGRDTP